MRLWIAVEPDLDRLDPVETVAVGDANSPDAPRLSVKVGFAPSLVDDTAVAARQIPVAEIEVGAPDYDTDPALELDPKSDPEEEYTRTDPDCPF